jgi:hypothetical protein
VKHFILLSLFLTFSQAFALNRGVEHLVHNETKSNAIAARSDDKVLMKHFEIPLDKVDADLSSRFSDKIRQSMIFQKDGQLYVRWLINPEDSKWYLEMKKFLEKSGLDSKEYQYYDGYQTASRSYIVEDPKNHAQFSLKVSTNKTGGNWKDKKQTAEDAVDVRRVTDYVVDSAHKKPFENFVIMDEPAAFTVSKIDQGMLVRELNELPDTSKYYLPGFSAVHTKAGTEIAKLNGSTNPAEFWDEHYNRKLAKALAELAGRTGVAYDSPHSQNFLVELDETFKPTGKIVLRDLGDVYLTTEIVKAAGGADVLTRWPKENIKKGYISASVGTLHGNNLPDWLTEEEYTKWGDSFYEEYDKELARVTGVPLAEVEGKHSQSGRYFTKSIKVTSSDWEKYLTQLEKNRSPAAAKIGCDGAFQAIAK